MNAVIEPVCNNKNDDLTDAANYRPVSIITINSKRFGHYNKYNGQ